MIDLTASPYNVVANDSTKGSQNTTGINLAISTLSGTQAFLLLPRGDVYLAQSSTDYWSIKFGTGVSDLVLGGQGMFATTLIQHGVGDGGEWHGLVIDGASRVELRDFGIRQGVIERPDQIQLNGLIAINNITASGVTRDIYGHYLYLGKSIGDQIRLLGDSGVVENVHFSRLLMRGGGVVIQAWAATTAYLVDAWVTNDGGKQYRCTTAGTSGSGGPTGTGTSITDGTVVWQYRVPRVGARSGISIQRGYRNVEFDHFYIQGVQNSGVDIEPSGSGEMTAAYLHDFWVDNSLGSTGTAAAFGGVSGPTAWAASTVYSLVGTLAKNAGESYEVTTAGTAASSGGPTGTGSAITDGTVVWKWVNTRAHHMRVCDAMITEGKIAIISTEDAWFENITQLAKYSFASNPSEEMFQVRQINHNLALRNLRLERIGTSSAGEVLSIENLGNRTLVEGVYIRQDTASYPMKLDGTSATQIQNTTLVHNGSSHSDRAALRVDAINGNCAGLSIDNLWVSAPSLKLLAAIYLGIRSPRQMTNVAISNVHSAGAATNGVYISLGSGGTVDTNPIFTSFKNGTDRVWAQVDASDNPITSIFPIIDGSSGTLSARRLEGDVAPNSNVIGNLGDLYTYRPTTTTADVFVKASQTVAGTPDNTGWIRLW